MKIEFRPDHYYLYDEMKQLMESWAQQCPELVRLDSIGTT